MSDPGRWVVRARAAVLIAAAGALACGRDPRGWPARLLAAQGTVEAERQGQLASGARRRSLLADEALPYR